MLRAVPSTMRMADSIVLALRSFILISAIERTFARVSFPILFLFGWPEPFSMPASLRMRSAAGGLFVTNGLTLGERDLVLRSVELDLAKDRADLAVGERRRLVAAAHEARHAGRVAHDVPRVVAHDHLDEDVTREHLPLDRVTLPVLDLDLFLGRHEHLEDLVAHVHRADAVLEV